MIARPSTAAHIIDQGTQFKLSLGDACGLGAIMWPLERDVQLTVEGHPLVTYTPSLSVSAREVHFGFVLDEVHWEGMEVEWLSPAAMHAKCGVLGLLVSCDWFRPACPAPSWIHSQTKFELAPK